MPEFRMPSLGADMESGTLLEWRVKPGDRVRRGDIVALVDTEKAEIEVEVFAEGIVEELVVMPGTKVPVGTVLARLVAPPEAAREAAPARAPALPPPATPRRVTPPAAPPAREALPPAPPSVAPPVVPAPPSRIHASPLARRIATERGVDLTALRGSGPGGAILREDVERAAGTRPPAPEREAPPLREAAAAPSATDERAARAAERALATRRSIAAAMARSKREIPHYYLATRVDMARAVRWLEQENLRRSVTQRLLPAALLLKATALALRETPELNGFFRDGVFAPSEAVHVGVAVSLRPAGLVAPAIHDVDRLSLDALMAALGDLVRRARTGVLRSSEMSDATVTVTNLGDQGVETVFGVIHPPQVALVGFGRLREEAWAEGGLVGARPVVTATLAGDHRASDGHRGGRFLSAVARLLQSPEAL
ncbi:MAG TPA: dihydrolipoamide acetyltransferase family protein [Myxococcota bacterium]|nr:dihydrolipoamide acetyltransferase family protein [Myxococcota bacterium]